MSQVAKSYEITCFYPISTGLKRHAICLIEILDWFKSELLRKKMGKKLIIFTVVFAVTLLGACEDGFKNTDEGPPDILTGSVLLENMDDHKGISVRLEELEASLVTENDGTFILPENLAEGEWTLVSKYPYFKTTSQTFVIKNGQPEEKLETMEMEQAVQFFVWTDQAEYFVGDTVFATIIAENVSDEPVTLASATSPQLAVAIRHEGEIILGGLFPGDQDEFSSVTIDPGAPYETEITWEIDSAFIVSGEYEVYALLTDRENHENYFDPDPEMSEQFNNTLYPKINFATIQIN